VPRQGNGRGPRIAAFLVPPISILILLYQALASLQIALTHVEAVIAIGMSLGAGMLAGVLAVFGGRPIRVLVLGLAAVVLIDVTFHTPLLFDRLAPDHRTPQRRDARRVADLHQLQDALEEYIQNVGPLPSPRDYGEGTGPASFWEGWWDLSSADQDGDGLPFLDFLVEHGGNPTVPVDPVNEAADSGDPRLGSQYVFFVVPAGYGYQGGACASTAGRWTYLLAITDLETETRRPPETFAGSGCACLWRDAPNFFQQHFDYVLCGIFTRK
jgi:hypothetical protein